MSGQQAQRAAANNFKGKRNSIKARSTNVQLAQLGTHCQSTLLNHTGTAVALRHASRWGVPAPVLLVHAHSAPTTATGNTWHTCQASWPSCCGWDTTQQTPYGVRRCVYTPVRQTADCTPEPRRQAQLMTPSPSHKACTHRHLTSTNKLKEHHTSTSSHTHPLSSRAPPQASPPAL
jgi:hypothetical protein